MTRLERGDSPIGLQGAVILVIATAVLYFARDVFIPIALAIVLTFLLAPIVRRVEQLGTRRMPAVLLVVGLATTFVGALGWMVFQQLVPLGEQLPEYVATMQKKLGVLRLSEAGTLSRLRDALINLGKGFALHESPVPIDAAAGPAQVLGPLLVRIVEQPTNPFTYALALAQVALGRLATVVIVVVFSIFMLMEREDLRDRVIHLLGVGAMHRTTTALDEAAERVSRFLTMQVAGNAVCGLLVGLGLWAIGVPSPALWGLLMTLLRFVPYIGAWIAGALPVLAALGGMPDPTAPLFVLGLVFVVEVGMSHLVEPLVFASGTGLSTVALVCSTVFWAWLWGPAGLLLATPLTVCLVVMGRHIPGLEVFDVLLGSRPALAPPIQFYQRLLAGDHDGSSRMIDLVTKEHGPIAAYDTLLVPAIRVAEIDRHRGELTGERDAKVDEMLAAFVDDLTGLTQQQNGSSPDAKPHSGHIVIIPARTRGDELAARMVADVLTTTGRPPELMSASTMTGEAVAHVESTQPSVVCISAMPPGSILHARVLAKRLRATLPNLPIVVGVWEESNDEASIRLRFGTAATDHIVTKIADAAEKVRTLAGPSNDGPIAPREGNAPSPRIEKNAVAAGEVSESEPRPDRSSDALVEQ